MPTRRVMQLVLSLSPGGTERLVIEICKRLAGRVEPYVCCLDARGAWAAELEALGIPVVALGRAPGFQPRLSLAIARRIRAERIDVVHCHHYTPYVYGLLATRLAPADLVFTEHGRLSDGAPSRKRRLVNPVLSRLGGRICAVSADLAQHMAAEGFLPGRVEVVYNGIEPGEAASAAARRQARDALGLPPDAFVVGTVGRLDRVKNLAQLLRAHARARPRLTSLQTVIVGDGPERANLEALARELGIGGEAHFAGHRDDARALLAAFDLYVNCSAYEGVSLTILEAMAAGLPVLAAPVGGNPEVVVDARTGRLVPSEPSALAAAMAEMAATPSQRAAMGAAGRRRVLQAFSLTRMVDAYAAAYSAPAASAASDAPTAVPTPAEPMSVSDATRSIV